MYWDNLQLTMNHLEKDFWKFNENQSDARKNSDYLKNLPITLNL